MFKGTTPTLVLTFDENVDFSEAEHVVVTFATDYHKKITEKDETEMTIEGNTIRILLTQAETLSLRAGSMLIQVNALYSDGSRVASNIATINWINNLKNEVMT